MTIKTYWNSIISIITSSFTFWSYMMSFKADSTEMMTNTTPYVNLKFGFIYSKNRVKIPSNPTSNYLSRVYPLHFFLFFYLFLCLLSLVIIVIVNILPSIIQINTSYKHKYDYSLDNITYVYIA